MNDKCKGLHSDSLDKKLLLPWHLKIYFFKSQITHDHFKNIIKSGKNDRFLTVYN